MTTRDRKSHHYQFSSNTTPLKDIRVLIVDANPYNCYLKAFLLKELGAIVTPVASASEAIQAIEKSRFDILLSDVGMPLIDVYTFIRAIQEQTFLQNHLISTIAITDHVEGMSPLEAITAGFQGYLTLPLDIDKIISLIIQLVPPSFGSLN